MTDQELAIERFYIKDGRLHSRATDTKVCGSRSINGVCYSALRIINIILNGDPEVDAGLLEPRYCEFCGKPLPEEELRMGAFNHRECWSKHVHEIRLENPEFREGYHKDCIDYVP